MTVYAVAVRQLQFSLDVKSGGPEPQVVPHFASGWKMCRFWFVANRSRFVTAGCASNHADAASPLNIGNQHTGAHS